MHGLRSEYTVLFFNNPGCPACRDIAGQMVASPEITQRVRDGRLTVLAVYPDEDLKAVAEHGRGLPGELGLCARQGRGAVGGELVRPEGYPDALPAGP